MRKFSLGALVCAIFFSQSLNAQNYYYNDKYFENSVVFEVGAHFGIMNSFTDLGGKKGIGKKFIKDLRWQTVRPSFGVYVLANYQDKLCLRLEGTFGQVTGYDSILKKVGPSTFGRYERNLSFKSKIAEVQLGLEIHPLMFKDYEDTDPPLLSPYALVGVGYYSFDPQAKLNGQWYSLQPLRLEGQGFKEYPDRKTYQLSQINFATGIGVRYQVSPLLTARMEFVHRTLTTDYLDDVSEMDYIDPTLFYSYLPTNKAAIAQQLADRRGELSGDVVNPNQQRGNPKNNDSYFTVQLKIGMTIGRQRR
ncbi:MAG: hypothetical protein NTW29_07965 [Bacteroidetes bacterium]|nr:hypothetical protein [Bacteroidota bacterium]